MHIVDLLALAEPNFQKGLCSPVSLLYEQARVMIMNTHTYDITPWGGWITANNAHESRFELIILCAGATNVLVTHMLTGGVWGFATAGHIISLHLTRDVRWLLAEDGVEAQLRAYVLLFNGLHCIFSCRIGNSRTPSITAIRHGLNLIHQSLDHIAQFPRQDTILFRAAFKMSEMIMGLGLVSRSRNAVSVIYDFSRWYGKYLKPFK